MEQLDWRSSKSLAKSLGTIVSIAGAFIATLYKGVAILKGVHHLQTYLSSHFSHKILIGYSEDYFLPLIV
jgi:hypothetical protein